jgi:hypothetical protein
VHSHGHPLVTWTRPTSSDKWDSTSPSGRTVMTKSLTKIPAPSSRSRRTGLRNSVYNRQARGPAADAAGPLICTSLFDCAPRTEAAGIQRLVAARRNWIHSGTHSHLTGIIAPIIIATDVAIIPQE